MLFVVCIWFVGCGGAKWRVVYLVIHLCSRRLPVFNRRGVKFASARRRWP